MRAICWAIVLSLVPLPALAQTAAELREIGGNFGLSPAQVRRLFQLYDGQAALANARADALRIDRRTLRAATIRLGAARPDISAEAFLGLIDGAPRFGHGLASQSAEALKGRSDLLVTDLRSIAVQGLVAADDLPPIAEAKAVLHWHARHRFCPNCGAGTQLVCGGWRRDCPQCKAEHFPRTDPVVIMLAIDGGRCLLGRTRRQPQFRPFALRFHPLRSRLSGGWLLRRLLGARLLGCRFAFCHGPVVQVAVSHFHAVRRKRMKLPCMIPSMSAGL